MNRTISTAVLALPLAVALTLGATAAQAAEGHGQFPGHGGVVQPDPVPPGPGGFANPEDDPEPPVGPDDFANPQPEPEPPAPPAPPAPQPPADEPVEPVEPEADEESEESEDTLEEESLEEDDADSAVEASSQNGFLQGLPLVGLIATGLALAAAVIAVLLARRGRKRSA